jgi:hypothetical protein
MLWKEIEHYAFAEVELPDELRVAFNVLRRCALITPLQPQALMPFEMIIK